MRLAILDHHLNNYHANTFLRLLREGKVRSDAEIVAAWESHPTGEDWCVKNGVRRGVTIEDTCKDADAVMILAPDNIDAHLALCQQAFPLNKPMFLDKYLAPNVGEAQQIVALAQQLGIPLLCSSGLRYAQEVQDLLHELNAPIEEMYARGMGKWAGYGIHTISPLVRAMGGNVKRIADTGTATVRLIALDYGEGRFATAEVRVAENGYQVLPWQVGVRPAGDTKYYTAQVAQFEQFYINQLQAILDFFGTGQPDMSLEDALAVVAILEAAERSQAEGGAWVTMESVYGGSTA